LKIFLLSLSLSVYSFLMPPILYFYPSQSHSFLLCSSVCLSVTLISLSCLPLYISIFLNLIHLQYVSPCLSHLSVMSPLVHLYLSQSHLFFLCFFFSLSLNSLCIFISLPFSSLSVPKALHSLSICLSLLFYLSAK
jgi:hypothetical protein